MARIKETFDSRAWFMLECDGHNCEQRFDDSQWYAYEDDLLADAKDDGWQILYKDEHPELERDMHYCPAHRLPECSTCTNIMVDLAVHARLRPGRISLFIDLMEEANPSWLPDVAYQLIAKPRLHARTIGTTDRLVRRSGHLGHRHGKASGRRARARPVRRPVYGAQVRAPHRSGFHGRVRRWHRPDDMECAAGRGPSAPPARLHRRNGHDPQGEGPVMGTHA